MASSSTSLNHTQSIIVTFRFFDIFAMFVRVRVRDKTYIISVGDGKQTIKWLGIISLMRYYDDTLAYTNDYRT